MSQPLPPDISSKKMIAALTGIVLGSFGIHKFMLGFTTAGVIQLLLFFLTCSTFSIVGLIEGIIYLTRSDEEFYRIYIVEQKQWF